jgi:hypothetical protein
MRPAIRKSRKKTFGPCALTLAAILGLLFAPWPAATQQTGPLPPPPSYSAPTPLPQPSSMPKSAPHQTTTESPLSTAPPKIPVDQIIQKFAEREAEFRKERDNYTYTQTFVIQTIDEYSGQPEGKRYEHVTDAPAPSLQRISMSQQDFDDLEHVQPFVLTTDELPKYDVKYAGQQQLDELNTYVFDVGPKKIEKNQRYFQGRIWVDQKDLAIVKTDGKAVPDIKKHGQENVFPRFETFRENIESHFWFPTYTHSEDTLQFSGGGVRIRMTVRYENYKRFGSTIKIGAPIEVPKEKP